MSEIPSRNDFDRALQEIAASGSDYHIAGTPQRMLELSQTANLFMGIAVDMKKASPDEIRLIRAHFNEYVDKWLRENEHRFLSLPKEGG